MHDEIRDRALAVLESGDAEAAERLCRDALARGSNDPELRCVLAAAMTRLGKPARSIRELRRVLAQVPNLANAHAELGSALLALHKPMDAIESMQRAIELDPALDATRARLARLLQSLGESRLNSGDAAGAIDAFRRGLEYEPHDGPLLSLLGHELRIIGELDEAIASYETCIAYHPTVGEVYYSLANLKTYRFSDTLLAQMEEQVANDSLRDEAKANFHFAIGKAYEDRKDFEQAFAHIEKGNALWRKHIIYDPDEVENFFSNISTVFSAEFLNDGDDAVSTTQEPTPIFVVGLPRSGSTLLEQILASHSQVEGIAEVPTLDRVIRKLNVKHEQGSHYPEAFLQITADGIEELGQQYLDATEKYRSDCKYFVDKTPTNFVFTGAIRKILPHAKIINAQRDPLSCCFSTFRQLFYDGQYYAYDMRELAHYYILYQQLMDHWHTVMPGFVLDVKYEDVVVDQEEQTRRMLEHCGLDFEESCLQFHETERAVATASSEQVRQEIYTDSLDAWRPYGPYINDLIEHLKPILERT